MRDMLATDLTVPDTIVVLARPFHHHWFTRQLFVPGPRTPNSDPDQSLGLCPDSSPRSALKHCYILQRSCNRYSRLQSDSDARSFLESRSRRPASFGIRREAAAKSCSIERRGCLNYSDQL